MSRAEILPHHSNCVRALQAIREKPGIQREALAATMKCSVGHLGSVLQALSKAKLAGHVPCDDNGGRARGWYVAEDLEEAAEAWAEIARKRELSRQRSKLSALNTMKAKARKAPASSKFVHRKLSAKTKRPLPFTCTAVNSVFSLGGQT